MYYLVLFFSFSFFFFSFRLSAVTCNGSKCISDTVFYMPLSAGGFDGWGMSVLSYLLTIPFLSSFFFLRTSICTYIYVFTNIAFIGERDEFSILVITSRWIGTITNYVFIPLLLYLRVKCVLYGYLNVCTCTLYICILPFRLRPVELSRFD